jgi:hypothetical protein
MACRRRTAHPPAVGGHVPARRIRELDRGAAPKHEAQPSRVRLAFRLESIGRFWVDNPPVGESPPDSSDGRPAGAAFAVAGLQLSVPARLALHPKSLLPALVLGC